MNDTPAAQNIHCSNHKMAEEIAPAELCIGELGFDVEVIEGELPVE